MQSFFVQPEYWYSPIGERCQASFVPPNTKMMSGSPSMYTRLRKHDAVTSRLKKPVPQMVVPPQELFFSSS